MFQCSNGLKPRPLPELGRGQEPQAWSGGNDSLGAAKTYFSGLSLRPYNSTSNDLLATVVSLNCRLWHGSVSFRFLILAFSFHSDVSLIFVSSLFPISLVLSLFPSLSLCRRTTPPPVFQRSRQRGEGAEPRVHGLHDVLRVRVVNAAWQTER